MIFLDLLKLVFIVLQVVFIFISCLACLTFLFKLHGFRSVSCIVIWICTFTNVMEPIACLCLYLVMLLVCLAYRSTLPVYLDILVLMHSLLK